MSAWNTKKIDDYNSTSILTSDDSSRSHSESLEKLPLPQITEGDEQLSYLKLDKENIKNSTKPSENFKSLYNKHTEPQKSFKSSIRIAQIDTWKIISKTRTGGKNIVKNIRQNSGNSYLARKQRYLENQSTGPSPNVSNYRCLSPYYLKSVKIPSNAAKSLNYPIRTPIKVKKTVNKIQ
jgi:hypothetical protein